MVCAFSLIYWIRVTFFILTSSKSIIYPINIFLIVAIVFAIIILIGNVSFKNLILNEKRFAAITLATSLILVFTILQSYTWYTAKLHKFRPHC